MTTALPAAYPLYWPEEWPRTPVSRRRASKYEVTFTRAREEAVRGVSFWAPSRNIVVSSNLPLRLDGLPLAGGREPREDPGIAIWWIDRKSSETRVIACDMWSTTRENMRACGLTIDAMRQVERSGATQILDRAMQTFASKGLPAPKPEWVYTLGLVDFPHSEAHVHTAFRERSKKAHPDCGGSHELFLELQGAHDAALAWLRGGHEE